MKGSLEIAQELAKRDDIKKSGKKLVLLVMDGLGDIRAASNGYRTPLEVAQTPNLDALAPASALGRIIPVDYGITPGSGPAHLGLFGYDPRVVEIGRGVMEVVGMGMELRAGDVAVRANFCTVKGNTVTDRRAGRPTTEASTQKVKLLQQRVRKIEDVELIMEPGEGHRFGIIFRGPGLSDGVNDTDPHQDGHEIHEAKGESPAAQKTARIINKLQMQALDVLKDGPPMNGIVMRGVSSRPAIATMQERMGLRCAAIATYPMYRGLASLVGMELLKTGASVEEEFQTYLDNRNNYDYFFIHVKPTDEAGEDGSPERKTKAIEAVDRALPVLLKAKPEVLAVTGDHSTPCPMKLHSWHPVPLMLHSPRCGADGALKFTESHCNGGSLGIFRAMYLLPLMLANGEMLDKFGA